MTQLKSRSASSISGQLTKWYFISIFVLVSLATTYLYLSLKRTIATENGAILTDRMKTLTTLLTDEADPLQAVRKKVNSEWAAWEFEKLLVKITGAQGEVMFQSYDQENDGLKDLFRKGGSEGPGLRDFETREVRSQDGRLYLVGSKRMKIKQGESLFPIFVDIALDLDNEDGLLRSYERRLIFVLILTLILSSFIGHSIARSGLRPLEEMVETTERIRSSTLSERMKVDRFPVELKKLAITINSMLDRLEESFGRLSRFSADLAHELRTPLNNIKGELEVSLGKERDQNYYREVAHSALEEVNRLSSLIDSLLFLAKAEDPKTQIRREKVSLNHELQKIVEFYEPAASEKSITIRLDPFDPISLEVEKTLFQRALGNVLGNAIKYSLSSSFVHIQAFAQTDWVSISVKDTGPGMSEEDLSKIFDRFYRVDPSRSTTHVSGFGLGLSIAKSILQLHGGRVEVKSQLGQGTEMILIFPLRKSF